MNPNLKGRKMSTETGNTASDMNLQALPGRISDAHRNLRETIERVCALEDFLFGSQVRGATAETQKEPDTGVLRKCFDNTNKMNNSILELNDRIEGMLTKLGAQDIIPPPERM